MKKQLIRNQKNATHRINVMLNGNAYTKKEIGEKIGITQPTLRIRMLKNNWRIGELEIIKNIYPF